MNTIFIGKTRQKRADKYVSGETVNLLSESYYVIRNVDAMEPFFISIVSGSDHWLFISSTGGLTAGRGSAEQAIFPYYTVDHITENNANTGHKAILLVTRAQRTSLWEPFSDCQRGSYAIERNLYKNVSGTALVFEESNRDLGLAFRYAWRTSDRYGFIMTAWLENAGGSSCQVEILDGLQNILPANITSQTQSTFSSLLDAYKRSELDAATGLAIFTLNSRLTDLAEPSESLQATTVFQLGLSQASYLLSSQQLDRFRCGEGINTETEVRGRRGAYFVHGEIALAPKETHAWHLITDVVQDSAAIAQRIQSLQGDQAGFLREVLEDVAAGQTGLWKIVASADGVQLTNQAQYPPHHFANVMFNVMRGGIFADQYWVRAQDFVDFVAVRNRPVLEMNAVFFAALPEKIHIAELQTRARASASADLVRLSYAYLPLIFSRRHGDPSRPWNRFAINLKKPDGSLNLDYEGNWRDIFQNWEALAYSYPEFVENMITTFLNATTLDGYNPYRITHHGVDWEMPDPGNPWANIGYWSDHQIIYLQKLMEISARFHPGALQDLMARPVFSYAQVPYKIRPYADLLKDPNASIEFDWELDRQIKARQAGYGTDGKLVWAAGAPGKVLQVTLAEKLLTLLLAKLANFVPEGGIWMNTQRPEWNDANNALVGKGLSVVTLCYLRRYIAFCYDLFSHSDLSAIPLSAEVERFFLQVEEILGRFQPVLPGAFSDEQRRAMMDQLGAAGSDYRWNIYRHGLSGQQAHLPAADIAAFLARAQQFVEHSLRANQRADHLFHAYNILHLATHRAAVSYLYEMLEGQVAILSSGMLSGEESLALLDGLRHSALYQADQHSYILYPDRSLPGFLAKNCLTAEQVQAVPLLSLLAEAQDRSILTRDVNGVYHFSGHIRNFRDVSRALDALREQPQYSQQAVADFERIQHLFEATFHHDQFTGRSGTFFAYEGLGSIYWHMVTKLLLAAQETVFLHRDAACATALAERYQDIRRGLGFNKSPQEYGAFPSDPYSHTPKGQGAKQPGMTGMVKEEILARQAELGFTVVAGRLVFDALLFDLSELLSASAEFTYLDVRGKKRQIALPAGSLAYTICQTPVILQAAKEASIVVHYADGNQQCIQGNTLDADNSQLIFLRDGKIDHLSVSF